MPFGYDSLIKPMYTVNSMVGRLSYQLAQGITWATLIFR